MNKGRSRPSQLLYVPPARRNSKKVNDDDLRYSNSNHKTKANKNEEESNSKNQQLLETTEPSSLKRRIQSNSYVESSKNLSETCSEVEWGNGSKVQLEEVSNSMKAVVINSEEYAKNTADSLISKENALAEVATKRNAIKNEMKCDRDEPTVTKKAEVLENNKFEAGNRDKVVANDSKDKSDAMNKVLIISSVENTLLKKNESEIDKEKEEMERAIVKINRKSRSLIKNYDNDILIIEKEGSPSTTETKASQMKRNEEYLYTWEDILFDDNLQRGDSKYQENRWSSDSLDSQNTFINVIDKKMEDLDHVIEVYDFPASFKTPDIMQLYSDVHKDPIYIRWCDDTHALLVFSSPAQAKLALKYDKGIIKARPMVEASALSKRIANKVDLKPAMRRPETNMQTARRLISRHLGTKSAVSKADLEKEKRALKDAKEKKRLQRESENDAWEGRPRTNI